MGTERLKIELKPTDLGLLFQVRLLHLVVAVLQGFARVTALWTVPIPFSTYNPAGLA